MTTPNLCRSHERHAERLRLRPWPALQPLPAVAAPDAAYAIATGAAEPGSPLPKPPLHAAQLLHTLPRPATTTMAATRWAKPDMPTSNRPTEAINIFCFCSWNNGNFLKNTH